MANWVEIIAALSGPPCELERLVQNCIRTPEQGSGTEFTIEATRLAPEIVTAPSASSVEISEAAHLANEHDGAHEYLLGCWGNAWTSFGFRLHHRTNEELVFSFACASCYPDAPFAELARQYPGIQAQLVAMEPACGWGAIAAIRGGRHTHARVACGHKLRYLIEDADPRALLPLKDAGEVPECLIDFGIEEGEARVRRAWQAALGISSPGEIALKELLDDAYGFLDWLELEYRSRRVPSRTVAQEALTMGFVEAERNLAFMLEEKRCATAVDRVVLIAALDAAQKSYNKQCDPERLQLLLNVLLRPFTEKELREWATLAMFREDVLPDARDQETLRNSVIHSAVSLVGRIKAHIGGFDPAVQGLTGRMQN